MRALIEPEYLVVGMVDDGRTLLVEAERLRPDVIVMEILLPLLNGLSAAQQLIKLVPRSKLVFLTLQESSRFVANAFRAGASAYLSKRSPASELSLAIRTVLSGQRFLTPLIIKDVCSSDAGDAGQDGFRVAWSSLTPRQLEVLQLIAEGRGTKEVATLLNIAVKTVEFHKFRIMDHLNLHSTVALTRHAIAEGLVSP